MDKHIQDWLDFKHNEADPILEKLDELQQIAEEKAKAPDFNSLKPATIDDIVKGNIFWYLPKNDDPDDNPFWNYVAKTREPTDPKDSYLAQDGDRYILESAYIEK